MKKSGLSQHSLFKSTSPTHSTIRQKEEDAAAGLVKLGESVVKSIEPTTVDTLQPHIVKGAWRSV